MYMYGVTVCARMTDVLQYHLMHIASFLIIRTYMYVYYVLYILVLYKMNKCNICTRKDEHYPVCDAIRTFCNCIDIMLIEPTICMQWENLVRTLIWQFGESIFGNNST